jgi:hypothetical protein
LLLSTVEKNRRAGRSGIAQESEGAGEMSCGDEDESKIFCLREKLNRQKLSAKDAADHGDHG